MKQLIDHTFAVALCGATMVATLAQDVTRPATPTPVAGPAAVPKGSSKPRQVEAVETFDRVPGGFGESRGSKSGFGGGEGYGAGGSTSRPSAPGRRSSTVINTDNRRKPEVTMRLNEVVAFDNKRSVSPLIIRTGKVDGKTTDELREDLAVMAHVLDKAAEENAESFHPRAAGIDILTLAHGGRPARTLYIEDYGAIFTLNVAMPLKGGAEPEEVVEQQATRNEEWEEARNELFGRKRRAARVHGHPFQREFDQGDMDELKNALLGSLKSARNIRHLKGNDSITVVVRGTGAELSEGRVELYADVSAVGLPMGEESMMVLRVKKSDLDQALENDDAPDLAKVVSVAVY